MTIPPEILELSETPASEWPEDLRKQVEGNPELLRMMAEQQHIASLMALKRYEKPDPSSEERLRSRIQERIRKGEARTPPILDFDALPDWVRMAAAVVIMLGLSILTHREMMDDQSDTVTFAGQAETIQPSAGFNTVVADVVPSEIFPRVERSFHPSVANGRPVSSGLLPRNPDPFITFVDPSNSDAPLLLQFSPDLARQIEESFMERSLIETNRFSTSPLLPVGVEPIP